MCSVRVKICGIRDLDEAAMAVDAGVHALGFVFADSPRKIAPRQAGEIIQELPPFVGKVGVFVDENPAVVKEIAAICGLDTLQFHGVESPLYCNGFSGYKVVKAFPVGEFLPVSQFARYRVDGYLLDTSYPDKRGGGGKSFNWDLLHEIKGGWAAGIPLILAGGLNPDNVAAALARCELFALDVSSGVEKDGKKDPARIRALMDEVCRWNLKDDHEKSRR